MIKGVSHLGFAVKSLEEGRQFYRSVFGLESSDPIEGGEGTVRVSMVEAGNTTIELLEPVGSESVIARFLEKRGEGIHHICFEVENIHQEVERLKTKGMEIIGEPRPGAEGVSVFLHPRSTHGVLIELVEKEG
ncbi:MAG: methylmalonyl-CoA epimerase [Candidatus Aminicenantales bacterium]